MRRPAVSPPVFAVILVLLVVAFIVGMVAFNYASAPWNWVGWAFGSVFIVAACTTSWWLRRRP
jgi:hypothetical protein